MIARRIKLQVIAFLVISVLGISYVGLRYVGLGGALFDHTYTVGAAFTDSGGIFSGAEVTYRGVTVGKVGRLHLRADGVLVDLQLKGATKVPRSAKAVVTDRSAVGEQYVDLQPDSSGGPFLKAGDVITRTEIPLPVQTLLLNLDRLVNSVNLPDLATVIDELGKAFAGAGPDLQRLLDNGDALLSEASANLDQTVSLIREGRTVLDTQRVSSTSIKQWAAGLATLSDQLRRSDPDLRKLLAEGPGASAELVSLLNGLRPTIGVLLSNLIVVGQVQGRRLAGLEQILVAYPAVTTGGFTVNQFDPRIGRWTSHFGFEMSPDPTACTAAYPKSHPAQNPQPGNCTASEQAAGGGVRGATNAPGSTNAPGANGAPPASSTGQQARPAPQAAGTTAAGGYDPLGMGTGPGSTGGQQQVLGDQSWQWLLLGPLAG